MKEITLKSGAVLKVGLPPFQDSKNFFQAVVRNMKSVEIDNKIDTLEAFVGALLGSQLADQEIERCLWLCMKQATYNSKKPGSADIKIDPVMFEPIEARMDFIEVCLEVSKENLAPFMNGLYVALPNLISMIGNIQKPT